ncbi:hypothetical protein AXG93_4332s1030 [Marchantia polymorpha subsp. ruderalis]|uniref:Uncharacterized protein n=1 Tax=Marchantia polymorpha subsp. ruderalis TaxID=1480154 RepID=A0A176W2C5_MARPO|nr:hypothetical protein AXG93_4332s1030 [Marchantia polymorpha subsp. ruderalis]
MQITLRSRTLLSSECPEVQLGQSNGHAMNGGGVSGGARKYRRMASEDARALRTGILRSEESKTAHEPNCKFPRERRVRKRTLPLPRFRRLSERPVQIICCVRLQQRLFEHRGHGATVAVSAFRGLIETKGPAKEACFWMETTGACQVTGALAFASCWRRVGGAVRGIYGTGPEDSEPVFGATPGEETRCCNVADFGKVKLTPYSRSGSLLTTFGLQSLGGFRLMQRLDKRTEPGYSQRVAQLGAVDTPTTYDGDLVGASDRAGAADADVESSLEMLQAFRSLNIPNYRMMVTYRKIWARHRQVIIINGAVRSGGTTCPLSPAILWPTGTAPVP